MKLADNQIDFNRRGKYLSNLRVNKTFLSIKLRIIKIETIMFGLL